MRVGHILYFPRLFVVLFRIGLGRWVW